MSSALAIDLLDASLDVAGESGEFETVQETTIRHLVFLLRDRPYAIEIRHVVEIVGMQPITPVHDVPSHIRGLMNLRGHVFPLVDAAERIGMATCEYDERTCVIVLLLEGAEVGLAVDRVTRVVDYPESGVREDGHSRAQGIRGVFRDGDEVVLCLDPYLLFEIQSDAEKESERGA